MNKTRCSLAMTAVLGAMLAARTAGATTSIQWASVGTGCATEIAVGPNNVPWIIGCGTNASGPHGVYYLGDSPSPVQGEYYSHSCGGPLYCAPNWNYAGFQGVMLAVSLNGYVFATDTTGTINAWSTSNNDVTDPGGDWYWAKEGHGAVSSFQVSVFNGNVAADQEELWGPNDGSVDYTGGYFGTQTVWGLGCGSNCSSAPISDATAWTQTMQIDPGVSAPGWGEMADQTHGGVTLALFTEPATSSGPYPGDGVYQTPWLLDAEGRVYVWNYPSWVEVATPGAVTSITDHHILVDGTVYDWTGVGTHSGTWQPVITAVEAAQGFVWLKQIAWSQYIVGTPAGPVGPSQLWGIDYSGNVYYTQAVPGQPE